MSFDPSLLPNAVAQGLRLRQGQQEIAQRDRALSLDELTARMADEYRRMALAQDDRQFGADLDYRNRALGQQGELAREGFSIDRERLKISERNLALAGAELALRRSGADREAALFSLFAGGKAPAGIDPRLAEAVGGMPAKDRLGYLAGSPPQGGLPGLYEMVRGELEGALAATSPEEREARMARLGTVTGTVSNLSGGDRYGGLFPGGATPGLEAGGGAGASGRGGIFRTPEERQAALDEVLGSIDEVADEGGTFQDFLREVNGTPGGLDAMKAAFYGDAEALTAISKRLAERFAETPVAPGQAAPRTPEVRGPLPPTSMSPPSGDPRFAVGGREAVQVDPSALAPPTRQLGGLGLAQGLGLPNAPRTSRALPTTPPGLQAALVEQMLSGGGGQ